MSFDINASTWDNDPKKTERAKVIAKEIQMVIPEKQDLSGFEFGCGTGLLSFALKDFFQKITLVDSSEGMIKVLREKIQDTNIKHFNALKTDLMQNDFPFAKVDVIYTLMSLHHIQDVNIILERFNALLSKDGFLCIADLVKEDGSFHSNGEDHYHNGFDKQWLTATLQKHNFEVIYYNICYTIEKQTENGINKFPLFLIISKKVM